MALFVDTLEATRLLEKAGFATPQAEAVIKVLSQAETRVATKDDLERVETKVSAKIDTKIAEVRSEIAEVRSEVSEVRSEVASLKENMSANTNKLVTLILALAGVIFAAVQLN